VVESPCSGSEAVLKAENAAVEMYRFAALMLGSEAEALQLVENTVTAFEIDPCADPCAAKGLVRDRVLQGALEIMHRQDPASFAAVPAAAPVSACLDEAKRPLSPANRSPRLWPAPDAAAFVTGSTASPRPSVPFLCSAPSSARTMLPPHPPSTASRAPLSGLPTR